MIFTCHKSFSEIFKGILKILLLYSPFLFIVFLACNKFQYSVYQDTLTVNEKNLTNKNIDKIHALPFKENFKFAVLADIHLNYDNFEACIDAINNRNDIEFVVLAGDFTDKGLQEEYQLIYQFLTELKVPYLTAVGNHDLGTQYGNGEIIYHQMFGDVNYTALINNIKFIFFDANINVKNDVPDFNWLHNQFTGTGTANKVLFISHQGPESPSFVGLDSLRNLYKKTISDPNILYSIFGHIHSYYNNDTLRCVTVDAIKERRHYCIVTIKNSRASVEQISY